MSFGGDDLDQRIRFLEKEIQKIDMDRQIRKLRSDYHSLTEQISANKKEIKETYARIGLGALGEDENNEKQKAAYDNISKLKNLNKEMKMELDKIKPVFESTESKYKKDKQELIGLKEKSKVLKDRQNAEHGVLNEMNKHTGLNWVDDKKYYTNKARVTSDKITEETAARKLVIALNEAYGGGAEYGKSPNGDYYRVFMSKEVIIDRLVDPAQGLKPVPRNFKKQATYTAAHN